ncbi:MAG: DUF1566 domain-containing protein [Candidatus Omnitrophota bacterium]
MKAIVAGQKFIVFIGFVGFVVFIGFGAVSSFAGNIDSPGLPGAGSGMYTLQAIHDYLYSGAIPSIAGAFQEPAAGPAGTMINMKDIYNGAAGIKTDADSCNAAAADVLTGKTFFATTGAIRGTNWGPVAGTMPDKEGDNASTAQSAAAGVNYFIAPTGFYDGDDRVSATNAQVAALDTDIAAGNIRDTVVIFGVTGTLSSGGLPKTGQTTQYSGKADDGFYQKGTARSYTANGDGTVTDNVTGLMWELKTDDSTIHDWDTVYTWANAFDVFIAALNVSPGFANHTDWRLPNVYELYSIALLEAGAISGVKAAGAPYINQTVFCTVPYYTKSSNYWSSTTYPDYTGSALYVNFSYGYVDGYDKTNPNYVRAVRGGQ